MNSIREVQKLNKLELENAVYVPASSTVSIFRLFPRYPKLTWPARLA
jgi:hypothetical protein